MKWIKEKSLMDGVMWWTEDRRYLLQRGSCGQVRRWQLYSVGEFMEKTNGYREREITKLADWPESPTAPTIKASEWLKSEKTKEGNYEN